MTDKSQSLSEKTLEERAVQLLDVVRRLLIAGLAAFTINIVATVTVYFNADHNDEAIDDTRRNSAEVKEFVDELEEPDPAAAERNAAVTRAVNLVPEIKSILCSPEAFPTAEGCQ